MAVGDGVNWNEALPDNNTVANQIDDYDRDLRVGVRSRLAREHIWPSSQTATNEGGHHTFVTLQAQTGAPTMAGTTAGCIFVTSSGLALVFENSAGTSIPLVNSGGFIPVSLSGGALGSIPVCTSGGSLVAVTGSADGLALIAHSNTAIASWGVVSTAGGGTGRTAKLAYDQKTRTSNYSLTGSETEITELAITITTKGTALFCDLTLHLNGNGGAYMAAWVYIDDIRKMRGQCGTASGTTGLQTANLHISHLETGLTAGSHTIKVKVLGSGTLECTTVGDTTQSIGGPARLTVLDLD